MLDFDIKALQILRKKLVVLLFLFFSLSPRKYIVSKRKVESGGQRTGIPIHSCSADILNF